MPTNKTTPAAETKTLPKNDSSSKESTKAAIASFKQNPYYSPLYDCDVNYFRYAFSSDSLTIKSAVAIKSIDIKPLKKDEKQITNKTTKTNIPPESTTDTQSTLAKTVNNENKSKNLSNPLTKSKSMIQTNVLQGKQNDSLSLNNEKSVPMKTQSGAMPPIKKSKSIIALNKKDGAESKFSTVKKSVKFKNEDIVKEIKSDQPLIELASKSVHLPASNTPLPIKPAEPPKNLTPTKQSKPNEINKPVVNNSKLSAVKPAIETSTITTANNISTSTNTTNISAPASATISAKVNTEPIKSQPVTKQHPKPVETQKPAVAANKTTINQNNNINNANNINSKINVTNAIQNTKSEAAKSSNNLANISSQVKPTNETAKSTVTGVLPAKTSSLIKPAEINKSQSNLVIQPKQPNDLNKNGNNQPSTHLITVQNKPLEPAKIHKTAEIITKANASLNIKSNNSSAPSSIKPNTSDSIKNVFKNSLYYYLFVCVKIKRISTASAIVF